MTRIIAICGLIVGLAALGYAVLLFCEHPEQPHTVESGTVVVEGAELGEVGLQSIVPAYIRIHNNSNVAIRFIGGPNGCQPGGCMKTTGQCPLTIDANSIADIPLVVSVSTLGSFQLSVCVYLDIAGAAVERTVYLTGSGIQAEENELIPTKP